MRRSLPRWPDHKTTAALFEKESSGDNDANLKGFASKTLPTPNQHLKIAQETH